MHHSFEHEVIELLKRIVERSERVVTSFRVYQFQPYDESKGVFTMPIIGIIPGATGVFIAVPLNAAGSPVALPLASVPAWTSSDPLAVATATPDGLGCSVVVDASAPQIGSFTLTVAMADGSASTAVTVPYDQAPADNTVASFGISQSS